MRFQFKQKRPFFGLLGGNSISRKLLIYKGFLACPPGIEPGTHSLEGCCSIQLSYGQLLERQKAREGLVGCLPVKGLGMVGAAGFELATLCSQSRCATRLRYAPTSDIVTLKNPVLGFEGKKVSFPV